MENRQNEVNISIFLLLLLSVIFYIYFLFSPYVLFWKHVLSVRKSGLVGD